VRGHFRNPDLVSEDPPHPGPSPTPGGGRSEKPTPMKERSTVYSNLFRTALAALSWAVLSTGCKPDSTPSISPSALSSPNPVIESKAFDGSRALNEVQAFVELGPKRAGTDETERGARWIQERLTGLGWTARIDAFTNDTPLGPLVFRNVLATLPGATPDLIVLGAHYDTKTGIEGFVGANDSGSGVGVLIELARVLKAIPKDQRPTLLLAFFDGEECQVEYGPKDGLHGSRRLAAQLRANATRTPVRAVVIADMVGDRDLTLTLPRNSSPELMRAIFAAAEAQGVRHRVRLAEGGILDDHVPFLEAGFPAIDLIDFQYGSEPDLNDYWHTTQDTMDKLSANSLELTGRLIYIFVMHMTKI
jgi:glutaminyl-peptide cyclotransferase